MKRFYVSENDRFEFSSTSKGNQIKWFKGNTYLKANTMGYEGIVEALIGELLNYIITDFAFVDYYPCEIEEDGRVYSGCYSYNCLNEGETFVSLYKILKLKYKNIDGVLRKINGKDLVNLIISTVKEVCNIDITSYLQFIVSLDAITLNEDRHLNNINILFYNNKYSIAPIFDNGLSLLSDTRDYQLDYPVSKNIRKVKSKPFSTDFLKQVSYFPSQLIVIDFDSFMSSIELNKAEFKTKGGMRARQVLLRRLRELEGILWRRL